MGRALTDRERDLLLMMIDSAEPITGDPPLSPDIRAQLRAQVPAARAGRRCDCGSCPSIEIEDGLGFTPSSGPRIVLSADAPGASLLLFIEGGRLSYLELASNTDAVITEFPNVSDVELSAITHDP